MLDKIVKTLLRHEHTIKSVSCLAIYSIGLGYALNVGFSLPERIRRLSHAKTEGIETRMINEGSIYREDFKKKHVIQIKDNSSGNYKTLWNTAEAGNYYPLISSLILLYVLRESLRQRKAGLRLELNLKEKAVKYSIEAASGLSIAEIINVRYMEPEPFFILGSAMVLGAVAYSGRYYEQHLLKKRLKENKSEEISKEYALARCGELYKAVIEQISKGKTDSVVNDIFEMIKLRRNIPRPAWNFAPLESFNPAYGIRHIYMRLCSNWKMDYKSAMMLILYDCAAASTLIKSDIEKIRNAHPKKQIELKFMEYEVCEEEKERHSVGKEAIDIVIKEGLLQPISEQSKNSVGYIKCGNLGIQYVVKMGNISNLTLEMKQTQNISSELRVKRVTLPENLEIYRPEEMAGNNNGVLIMRYANGISLAEYIEDLELEEKLKILKRVVEGNAKSSSFGMSRTEEDRLKKAHTDLENNKEIKNEVKNKIRGNLDVLLKFSNVFSSVYDRDGHAENAIVTRNENIVLIDFEVRLLSDPVYMLVKLIEHSKCFGYDEEGFKARKLLISEHFKNIGIEKEYNDTKINEAHYFSSVPLKALSYHSFSYGKNRKKTRTNYLMAANFALDVLLKEYGELYTKEERNKLKDLKYCMQAMPL